MTRRRKKRHPTPPPSPPPPPPPPQRKKRPPPPPRRKKRPPTPPPSPPPPPPSPPPPPPSPPPPPRNEQDPPPPPPYPPYAYDIPESCKFTFVLNSDLLFTQISYIQTIAFIRTIVSQNGSSFGKARNNTTSKWEKYPLLEITILYRDESLAVKLIIRKIDLYVIGFLVDDTGYHYTNYKILGFSDLGHTGSYSPSTLNELEIGPKVLTQALFNLHNVKVADKGKVGEVFFLHFGEGARFHLVESLVYKTLASTAVAHGERTIVDKLNFQFLDNQGHYIAAVDDALELMRNDVYVDTEEDFSMDDCLKPIITSYKHLCKCWYIYHLTNEKTTFLRPQLVSTCFVGGTETLRHMLAILPNISSVGFIKELEKKSNNESVKNYNKEEHDVLLGQVDALKSAGLAFFD